MKQISRTATAAEIIEIVGPLDDAVLMRNSGDPSGAGRGARGLHLGKRRRSDRHRAGARARGVGARAYDILKREEPEPSQRK